MSKAFTLIELLIVMGIMAVLAGGVWVLINPIDKLNAANDTKVQSDIAQIATGAQSYGTTHDGFYPASLADMVTSGDLSVTPSAPGGYLYGYVLAATPGGCTGGSTCTTLVITGQLKSKKYTATPYWRWESTTSKACAVGNPTDACP